MAFRRTTIRAWVLGASCLSVIGAAAPATAQTSTDSSAQTQADDANKPIRPSAGTIRTFAGTIRTFAGGLSGTAGTIRTFKGETEANAGTIRTFAGNIRTFGVDNRDFQAAVYPSAGTDPAFWGTLAPAQGTAAPSSSSIQAFSSRFDSLAQNVRGTFNAPSPSSDAFFALKSMISASEATWGAAVAERTGKTFRQAVVAPMLAKYGISMNDPSSLEDFNEAITELFLLDWYDNLMNYAGIDIADHWMKTVNWSPALTQQVSRPAPARIGLLDFPVNGSEAGNVILAAGYEGIDSLHGTAVASLIVGLHDQRGVMGIAPTAQVVAYNPFDETLTAGWNDIREGLRLFAQRGVSVVNMSLGVPGWTLSEGWNSVFANDQPIVAAAKRQLFVLAAGNDGVVQPANIEWNTERNPVIMVVGSVDPNGNISAFSNTPGTTCLVSRGVCASDDDLLMNHFIVAPGEFMLVSDGQGGVTRMSGTSFAAPLVSGAATLISDRWQWLKPADVAGIIFDSAKDLGEPGVDPVYGHGLLDVEAALSAPGVDKLYWNVAVNGTIVWRNASEFLRQAYANRSTWKALGATVTLFDKTATSARDFTIPMSTQLIGQPIGQVGQALASAVSNGKLGRAFGFSSDPSDSTKRFVGFSEGRTAAGLAGFGELQASLTLAPRAPMPGLRASTPFDSALTLASQDGKLRMALGSGSGAANLTAQATFGLRSDYDVFTGGANPFLGLASGAGFVGFDYGLGNGVRVALGMTSRSDEKFVDTVNLHNSDLRYFKAKATTLSVTYDPASWVHSSVTWTMLDEHDSLLGMQSINPDDLRNGARTDAATVGLTLAPTASLSIAASATVGKTRQSSDVTQNLTVTDGGLTSTSWQMAVTKRGVFSKADSARISFAQPMHLENGNIAFQSVGIIDRETGEMGLTTQQLRLGGAKRAHVAEALYRRDIMGGDADLGLFARMRMGPTDDRAPESAVTVGTNVSFRF